MKRYKIYPETTSFYYSTLSVIEWMPVFQDDYLFRIIIDSLQFCRNQKGLFLLGYIIIPTHLHMITANEENTTLSDIMRDFKNFTSKELRKQLINEDRMAIVRVFEKAAENLPKQQFKVWQDDYHPVALTSEKWFHQKMDYMHDNPVRKGFVDLPEHWKYSSARNWLKNDNHIIEIDKDIYTLTRAKP